MKIDRLALIFLLAMIGGDLSAQSFENMPETRKGKNPFVHFNWEIYIRRTQVSSKFVESYGGTTINAKFRADAFEKSIVHPTIRPGPEMYHSCSTRKRGQFGRHAKL